MTRINHITAQNKILEIEEIYIHRKCNQFFWNNKRDKMQGECHCIKLPHFSRTHSLVQSWQFLSNTHSLEFLYRALIYLCE